MSILADHQIKALCLTIDPMIHPFCSSLVREWDGKKVISYGLTSYGYDISCGDTFYVSDWDDFSVLDPKNVDPEAFKVQTGPFVDIPPNGFILTHSLETFRMPDDVLGVVLGKSTYARVGVSCLATPLEPGWQGQITLEFANTTPRPVRFYANEGCAQVLFFQGERPDVTYADRAGKYQGQRGVTLSRL